MAISIFESHQILDPRYVLDPRQNFINLRNPFYSCNVLTQATHEPRHPRHLGNLQTHGIHKI